MGSTDLLGDHSDALGLYQDVSSRASEKAVRSKIYSQGTAKKDGCRTGYGIRKERQKEREGITTISLSAIPNLPILKTFVFPFQIYNMMTAFFAILN